MKEDRDPVQCPHYTKEDMEARRQVCHPWLSELSSPGLPLTSWSYRTSLTPAAFILGQGEPWGEVPGRTEHGRACLF